MFRLLYIYIYIYMVTCVYTIIRMFPPRNNHSDGITFFCGKKKNIHGASPFQIPYHPIFFKNKKVFKQKPTASSSKSTSTQKCGWFQPNQPSNLLHPSTRFFGRAPSGRYQCVGLDHATRHRNQHDPGSFGWVAFDGLKLQVWRYGLGPDGFQCKDMQLKFFFKRVFRGWRNRIKVGGMDCRVLCISSGWILIFHQTNINIKISMGTFGADIYI